MTEAFMEDFIERSVELKAPLSKVWSALTDYRQFGQWFHVKIDKPFEVGKTSSGDITYPGYSHVKWNAFIKKLEPKHLFAFTWHPYAVQTNKDYSKESPTLVEFELEESPEGTVLTVTESGFSQLPLERRLIAFSQNDEGWAKQVKNIEQYLGGK
jgi:uncharacterized protein YndB with AHSA1/START domain